MIEIKRIGQIIKNLICYSGNRPQPLSNEYLKRRLKIINSGDTSNDFIDLNVIIERLERIPGILDPLEGLMLMTLSMNSQSIKPVVEVGSYLGKSTSYIGWGAKIAGKLGGVYAVDIFPSVDDWYEGEDGMFHLPNSDYYLEKEVYKKRSKFLYGDGYQKNLDIFKDILSILGMEDIVFPFKGTSLDFKNRISGDGSFSMIFIDGDHTYSGVKKDINNLVDNLESGGYICLHDYSSYFPGVKKAVNELIIRSSKFKNKFLLKSLFIACKN